MSPSPALIGLVARLFPLRVPREFDNVSPAAERPRFRRWDVFGVVAFFAVAPLAVYVTHFLLMAYASTFAPAEPDAIHRLTAAAPFWYVPASFIGVVLACVAIHLMYRAALVDGGRLYRFVGNATVGFDASRMYVAFGVLTFGAGMLLAYFAARTSLQLTPSEIVMTRMWSVDEERHAYSDIAALKQVDEPEKQKAYFVIEFTNAPQWSTAVEVVFPDEAQQAFLAVQTGRSIEHVTLP
jgi:hypothetical protein